MKQFIQKHTLIIVLSIFVLVSAFVALTKPRASIFAAVPNVPTDVVATPGNQEVTLTWTAPKGDPEGYYVRHNNPNTTLDTRSISTSYTVKGLTNGTTYTFYVAAYNREGTSSYSTAVTATPSAQVSVPGAPVLTTATPGDAQISLIWNAPLDNGGEAISNYRVAYSIAGGSVNYATVGDVKGYTLTPAMNDFEYTFTVAAGNSAGYGPESNALSATPTASVVAVPDAPSIGTLSPGNGQVSVSWTAPREDGGSPITGYTLSYTPEGGSEQIVSLGDVTSYRITNLTNGVRYSVKIAAENSEGLGSYSSISTAIPFTIPDAPTNLTLTPGDTTLSISWTAPNTNGSDITRYVISYTPSGGSEQLVAVNDGSSTSYLLEGLTNGVTYSVKVLAQNAAGTSTYTSTSSSAPDQNVAPEIVGVPVATVTDTTATVTWQTNKYMSTRVDFGLLNVSARSTTEANTGIKVINHSATVSGLISCTTYSYRVFSKDALNQTAVSSTKNFTTSGCEGEATVKAVERDSVAVASGGELDFRGTVDAKLVVPANVKVGEEDLVFQVKKLEKTEVQSSISVPATQKVWLGDHAYKLTAYASETEEVEDFDSSVTITIEYDETDIQGINQNTLSIYHYHDAEEGWHILENCTNTYNSQTGTGVISCTTPNFSVFGLFGEPETSGGGSSGVYVPPVIVNEILNPDTTNEQSVEDIVSSDDKIVISSNPVQFMKDLWRGINNSIDVLNLQKFLNSQGFILAEDGPGSPGNETSYFGPKTQNALKLFQEKYSEQILSPLGLRTPTGYFGIMTRNFINENF